MAPQQTQLLAAMPPMPKTMPSFSPSYSHSVPVVTRDSSSVSSSTTRPNSETRPLPTNTSALSSIATPRSAPLTSASLTGLAARQNTPTRSTITTATSAPWPIPSSVSKPGRAGVSEHVRSNLALNIGLIIPPTQLSGSPSHSSTPSPSCSSLETTIDSLHWQSRDTAASIPEECDEETCSESLPNDPVTPISGRQSQDFRFYEHPDQFNDLVSNSLVAGSLGNAGNTDGPLTQGNKVLLPVPLSHSAPTRALPARLAPTPFAPTPEHHSPPSEEGVTIPESSTQLASRSYSKRHSTLSRAMSSLFRRSNNHSDEQTAGSVSGTVTPKDSIDGHSRRRRFSYRSGATRSNTPPSQPAVIEPRSSNASPRPGSGEFSSSPAKKHRALTGISLRQKVNFVTAGKAHQPRRAKSLERKGNAGEEDPLTRQPWALPPEAGTGMKARRLSLSLPDDFTVDVAELQKEYEYHHLLGRHGKHLGKGATAKVSLMVRKGYPGELYAVKEFRARSSSESVDEYEKKIKSEYSIAKSLHHPNVIETIRLCTDHGRWNHVMEYCSEGDLFSLVSKKYLREEGREVDRVCLFKQLCQGINYLHKNGIAHRDIKLENLLITKDSKLKITDFGVSEVFSGIHPGLREAGGQCGIAMGEVRYCKPAICGSMPYIAPEVIIKEDEYDPRALDVWSSAIVMIYLIFGANLWEKAAKGQNNRTYDELISGWARIDAKRAANPEDAKDSVPRVQAFDYFVKPLPLRRLITNMLHPDPKKRFTMQEVVSYRWLKNAECCQFESYDEPVKVIDAAKMSHAKASSGKIYCHNHLPLMSTGHGLPPMPGKPGY